MEKKMNIATLFGRLFKSVREYTKPSILSPVFVMGEVIMKGRTVFVIAHRLSTIRDADKILVLEKGRITESGSNAELLALHGTYWRLNTGALELA